MKRWQEFFVWGLCFVLVDVGFGLIRTMVENGALDKYVFVGAALAGLLIGWGALFFIANLSKQKKSVKKNPWVFGAVYFILIWSVYMAFEVIDFSLAHNMLNKWYFMTIGMVCMFIGWSAGRMDNMLPKAKKVKKKRV